MLVPPPTLTPMERSLLQRLQDLETHRERRLSRIEARLEALETGIRSRDEAIARLSDMLQRLLGPLPPDGSSAP
jgi:chaperonin cofactor prefoldin